MDTNKYYGSTEVMERVNISRMQLFYWELKGIITPTRITMGSRKFKRYSQMDIETLAELKKYLNQGYTLSSASKRLKVQ